MSTTTAFTVAENKVPYHSKYIATVEFNKLTAENFAGRLPEANLARKYDIANFT